MPILLDWLSDRYRPPYTISAHMSSSGARGAGIARAKAKAALPQAGARAGGRAAVATALPACGVRRYYAPMQMQADSRSASPRARLAGAQRAGALALCALAGAAAISACGSSAKSPASSSSAPTGRLLNMHTVVGSIEESFLTKRHIHANVTCPTHVEQRAGNNFTCEASGFAGSGKSRKPFRVHVAVTQVNNAGYVKYVSY